MSQNIKTIKIHNKENNITEERNIGVDAERVDCGESTLDAELHEIDNQLNNINTSIQDLEQNNTTINNTLQNLQQQNTDINTTMQNLEQQDTNLSNLINNTKQELNDKIDNIIIQNNEQLLQEADSMPNYGMPTVIDYDNVGISALFLRKILYGSYGDEKNIEKKFISLVPAGSLEITQPGGTNMNIISTILYKIVDNSQINNLTDTQMILAEALTYDANAKVGDSINITRYKDVQPLGSISTQYFDKTNIISYNASEMPTAYNTAYNAYSLWQENQFLRNCIKDLYTQINELKNN